MDTIFINSEDSKTSKPHVLILNLTDKIDSRRGGTSVAYSNLSIYYTWKNIKSSYNNNTFKISASTWTDEFKLLDGHALYKIFKIILSIFKKNMEKILIIHQ